ncbi:MAG: PAS domain S-box protein [Dehalococcoidia bacterium]|jgi:PAS domain S-box-containing protein
MMTENLNAAKETEKLLVQENRRIQKYLDTADVIIVVLDANEKVVLVNRKGCQVLGYDEKEILGVNWFEGFITQRVREESRQVYQRFVSRKKDVPVIFERPVITRKGEERIVAWSNALLKDDAGRITGVVWSGEDITDRKKIDSELSLRTHLLDLAVDSIYVINAAGHIVFANEASWRTLGYGEIEFLGINIAKIVDPKSRAIMTERIKKVFQDGEITYESAHYRKDGSMVPVEVHGRLVVVDGKKLISCIARDMTERKLTEEVLKRSEERFRTILEDMDNGYFELDKKSHYIFVNDAMCKILGYSRADIVAKHFGSFIDQSDEKFVENSRAIMDEAIRTGMTLSGLFGTIVKGDGSRRIIGVSVSPLRDATGNIAGIRGITRDITDRMKMEQQLLMAGKLASIGELAAGVAHEINNPLTAIMGYAQLLAAQDDIPEHIKLDLDKIFSQSQRAARIVQNLLTFARSYALEKKIIDINDLILKSLELRSYEHNVGNIEIITDLQPRLPGISADENQILQVLLNIIINAEHAITSKKREGKIKVTTRLENSMVKIILADDGPGIPRQMLERLFDPFFTTKEVGQGTGLGLSVCHGIVTKHGGRIYAESVEGQGATFIIELPASREGKPKDQGSFIKLGKDSPKLEVSKRILVVDDELVIRDILIRILSEKGYHVESAASGTEGLEKIMNSKYDVYLLDIKMPGVDGRDMYDAISEKFPQLINRVIFITGDTITRSTLDFLETTGREYLSKPLDFSRLVNTIEEVTAAN